jgi:cell division protease FtsH
MTNPEKPGKMKTFMVAALIGVLCVSAFVLTATQKPAPSSKKIAFSQFLDDLAAEKISTVTIDERAHTVTGLTSSKSVFQTSYPAQYPLTERLELAQVKFDVAGTHSSSTGILILLGVAGFIAFLLLVNRSRNGKSKAGSGGPARMVEAGEIPVTFKDVAGCDEVVEELSEIKGFLADPERFRALGASIPKGVLLFGPPGTGKTLLARAVAGEAGVPFFSISGSDFVEMYVGVGASRVRKLFENAKAQAPCVIFIDEIDAVGRRRSGNSQGGQEERENTLNQLLVEIDGFAPNDNVIVMAASNRADILDPALTRPGRFDRQVIVDVPDRPGRREILDIHAKGKPISKEIDLDTVAAQTAGFCGADLCNLLNEAALLAARNGRKEIELHDMDEATMRVMAGPQKTRLMTDREKLVTAAHEMGHAIVAHELPDAEPVHKVTIVGRGRALGLTVMLQEEDKLLRTRTELMSQLAVALGGRVAEEIMFEEITTGAANDLEKVNQIAQAMVLKLGMCDEFALRSFIMDERLSVHSDTLSAKIDEEIDNIVREAKQIAIDILTMHKAQLQELTQQLIDLETIDREEFERLMRVERPEGAQVVDLGFRRKTSGGEDAVAA